MSCPVVRPVTISFSDLQEKKASLSTMIEKGLGPEGLGIISVSDVPGYSTLRQKLLLLSPRLANLPEEEKKKIEDPHCRYNFGWSHGKEKLGSGKLDTLKGSFYANPMLDIPTTDESLIQRYPSYCGRNIWPDSSLPELEDAFKSLGQMIFNVGVLVAYHCDQYVSRGMHRGTKGNLEQILESSRCHKGRLLYYFPAQQSASTNDDDLMSSWCGWHTDHGCLTGLTCSIYSRDGVEIPCLDSVAGLYIRTRSDHIVKVVYGEDEIAYQIGETTEILSGGYLCATPHCVRAPKSKEASSLERSTFALFMQPDWYVTIVFSFHLIAPKTTAVSGHYTSCRDEVLKFPENVHIHKELIKSNGCLTFGEYTEKLLDKYYHTKP